MNRRVGAIATLLAVPVLAVGVLASGSAASAHVSHSLSRREALRAGEPPWRPGDKTGPVGRPLHVLPYSDYLKTLHKHKASLSDQVSPDTGQQWCAAESAGACGDNQDLNDTSTFMVANGEGRQYNLYDDDACNGNDFVTNTCPFYGGGFNTFFSGDPIVILDNTSNAICLGATASNLAGTTRECPGNPDTYGVEEVACYNECSSSYDPSSNGFIDVAVVNFYANGEVYLERSNGVGGNWNWNDAGSDTQDLSWNFLG